MAFQLSDQSLYRGQARSNRLQTWPRVEFVISTLQAWHGFLTFQVQHHRYLINLSVFVHQLELPNAACVLLLSNNECKRQTLSHSIQAAQPTSALQLPTTYMITIHFQMIKTQPNPRTLSELDRSPDRPPMPSSK